MDGCGAHEREVDDLQSKVDEAIGVLTGRDELRHPGEVEREREAARRRRRLDDDRDEDDA